MAGSRVPGPVRSAPGSPEAWERFLGGRVEAGLSLFSETLRADALNMAEALEREPRCWLGALALANAGEASTGPGSWASTQASR
jgi:hypothetical protein